LGAGWPGPELGYFVFFVFGLFCQRWNAENANTLFAIDLV